MRLAFSVAAHLEPEVNRLMRYWPSGISDFRRSAWAGCRSSAAAEERCSSCRTACRSVLRLCPRVILLDDGRVSLDGTASAVIEHYMGKDGGAAVREWRDIATAPGDEQVRLTALRIVDEKGDPAPEIDIRQPVFLEVEYWNLTDDPNFRPFANVHLFNSEGTCLFISLDSNNESWRSTPRRRGLVPGSLPNPGELPGGGRAFRHRCGDLAQPDDRAPSRE